MLVRQQYTSTPKRRYNKNEGKARKQQALIMVPARNRLTFDPRGSSKPERKNIDTSVTAYSCPLTSSYGTVTLLNGTVRGTNVGERIGRKILMKSVFIRLNSIANSNNASQVRYIIAYDRQTLGATPSSASILDIANFTGMANLSNAERYVILCDEITDSRQSNSVNISSKRFIKCNLETMYSGNAGTVADINTGALWFMAANNSDQTTGATNTVDFTVRIRYIDN